MIHNTMIEKTQELRALKGRIFNPSLMIIGPFMPLLVVSAVPVSLAFLVFPLIDFFSEPRRLCRKYISKFQGAYIAIFVTCASMRLAAEFYPIMWPIAALVGLVLMMGWTRFSWTRWRDLYDQAQIEGNEQETAE